MVNEEYNTAIYSAAGTWCEEAEKKDMAADVLKAGHEKYPEHTVSELITRRNKRT